MPRTEMMEVKGLPELKARLRELQLAPDKASVTRALHAGATIVREEAIRRAPIAAAPHVLGRRRNVIVQPGYLRAAIAAASDRKTEFFSTVVVYVRSKAFYWRFLEFGTRYIRARPFMRPALETRRYEALDRVISALRRRIESVARTRLS